MSSLTLSLDSDLERLLDEVSRASGRQPAEVASDALRRQLAILRFDQVRAKIAPAAEARGYLTDEDVFRDVS
jgi:predicted transcriptional regulator